MKDSQMFKPCLLTVLLVWIPSSQSEPEIIQTSSGPIMGSIVNFKDQKVSQYLGIPFAQPPLGDLRFKKPLPVQPWSKTLEAKEMPPACIQYSDYHFPGFDFKPNQSENCLYLNIWVPEAKESDSVLTNKSVFFWIHGGSFAHGSNQLPVYNGQALAAVGDVIVVTINYRLGAFGFFTTNTDAAPANVALHDMLEALKWVNKNIHAFGGDPNQVTISGESAGSISVGLLCVSPLTKGLFNRVIKESGSHASPSFDVEMTSLLISQKLAEALECADVLTNIQTSPDAVVSCMRKVGPHEIAKTLDSFNPKMGMLYIPTYGNEILPYNAREALIAGNFHDASVLIGNNRDEGSVFLAASNPEIFGFNGKRLQKLNASVAEDLLKYVFKDTLKDIPNTDLIRQIILGRLRGDNYKKNIKIIYDVFGDVIFVCPDVYFAESYSRCNNDVYFYVFSHRPSTTPWAEWMGVVHYEEVQFVFGSPLINDNYTQEEIEFSRLMIKIWTNFVKYGDPFPEKTNNSQSDRYGTAKSRLNLDKWPKYSREVPAYLVLNTNTTKEKKHKLGPHKLNCDLFRSSFGFP